MPGPSPPNSYPHLAESVRWLDHSFSILGRIGGDATVVLRSDASDAHSLSVSSVGSEAMQRGPAGAAVSDACALSVSSVGSEAMQQWASDPGDQVNALSVSSVGSEAMQRSETSTEPPGQITFSILGRIGGDATIIIGVGAILVVAFQYPRSDRRRCNSLSRSGIGRILLFFQYPRSDRRRCNAGGHRPGGCESHNFQYPRSDRRRCNGESGTASAPVPPDFQYPRSDRRRCNHFPVRETTLRKYPFSILGRIGGDATITRKEQKALAHRHFQYPRSDRRRCNQGFSCRIRV